MALATDEDVIGLGLLIVVKTLLNPLLKPAAKVGLIGQRFGLSGLFKLPQRRPQLRGRRPTACSLN